MGHKESLLFCDGEERLKELCVLLNKAVLDDSKMGLNSVGLEVLAVGRVKKSMEEAIKAGPVFKEDIQRIWAAGSYFVWCNEKDKLRDSDWLWSYMEKLSAPSVIVCWPTYIDFISSPLLSKLHGQDMLAGMNEGNPGECRESEWVKVFYPRNDGQIDLKLIEKL